MNEQEKLQQLKKKLWAAYWAQRTLEDHISYAQKLRSLAEGVRGIAYDSISVKGGGGQGPALERAVIQLVEYEHGLESDVEHLVDSLRELDSLISLIDDAQLRLIMLKRYRQYESWEQIAYEMHFSWQWLHKLHKKALKILTSKQ